MTARPQENVVNNIALLPLPEPPRWCITGAEQKTELCTWADNYARANLSAALASAQAREESIVRQLRIETDRANAQYDRAERLEAALRLIESAKRRGFGIDYARGVVEGTLPELNTTNAATQTGETT